MLNSNAEILIYRKSTVLDTYGRRIKEDCDWQEVYRAVCVLYSPDLPKKLYRRKYVQEVLEQEREIATFTFDSHDQQIIPPDVSKDDYIAYIQDPDPLNPIFYWYKVIQTISRPTFNFGNGVQCVRFTITTGRIVPRECPKPLRTMALSRMTP